MFSLVVGKLAFHSELKTLGSVCVWLIKLSSNIQVSV